MFVRNLSQSTLRMKNISNGKKLEILPKEIKLVDEVDFPPERIKKLWGRYAHIITEKIEEQVNEIPTKPQENLELKEGESTLPTTNETPSENQDEQDSGDKTGDSDADSEDAGDESGDADELVNEVLNEVENESGEEKPEEKTPTEKSKKQNKKSAKGSKKSK